MKLQKYKITCLKCKKSSLINIINETKPMFIDHTPIIAARFRSDLKFGFECMCGNDSRVAASEASQLDKIVMGSSLSIKQIAKQLKIKDESKFTMVEVA